MESSKRCETRENNGENIVIVDGKLIFAGRDCYLIPEELYRYAGKVKSLDLSFNCIKDLEGLSIFSQTLEELILDNNQIDDSTEFPSLPRVTLLSLSKNNITDLDAFIDQVEQKCPSLTYLSLLGNQACPDSLTHTEADDADYSRYRKYVVYKFPKLKFLDSQLVTKEERQQARKQGPYLRVVRPVMSDIQSDDSSETAYSPLPAESRQPNSRGMYKKAKYIYHGKHSEGNRFIRNNDL